MIRGCYHRICRLLINACKGENNLEAYMQANTSSTIITCVGFDIAQSPYASWEPVIAIVFVPKT